MLFVDNISDGDYVYQRCLLISGRDNELDVNDGTVRIITRDTAGQVTFPEQQWPLCGGFFKSLLMLSPGENHITLNTTVQAAEKVESHQSTKLVVNYIPLLQVPPLHLAILVAKDSPLRIDCPPAKYGAISSAHSSMDAAIAKLRMSAYMWQALTAEDLRAKGLGRRTFRLEEEWGEDTLSQIYQDGKHEGDLRSAMQSTAKVHIIGTELTVAELRDAQKAQQNPNGRNRDELHQIFSDALKQYGGVFEPSACPIVAGLILDSHYSIKQDLILAHAALGAHNPKGLSLGIFGSHLCYSWPRFMEEVAGCLLDTTIPGETMGNDNGECLTMWEACSIGQGAFLHEVGHAFSAPHTSGIMARGYSQNWPKCFLSRTAYCAAKESSGIAPVSPTTPNDCQWDIRDALRFAGLPHFKLPGDPILDPRDASAAPQAELVDDEDFVRLVATSKTGIAQAILDGEVQGEASVSKPAKTIQYTADELESRFDRNKPLTLELLGSNGKHRTLDVWKLFSNRSYIRVPGTTIVLQKKSIDSRKADEDPSSYWEWAVMLKKKSNRAGKSLVRAKKIDLRVGAALDGAIVYYDDGSQIPCGPLRQDMGGHQARKLALPPSADIVKVQVAHQKLPSGSDLDGLRMHLSNGKAMGALNRRDEVSTLRPEPNHRIIGFYGSSGTYGMAYEFGIITAPKDAELPDSLYDLPELQNPVGGGRRSKGKMAGEDPEAEDDCDTSEDEDCNYDDDNQGDGSESD